MNKKSFVLEQGLYLSWGIALAATLGSLYFSEIQKFIPCTYCWYQRILMYPLVILLGIAAVRNDYKQSYYVLPFSVLGMGMSTYHYLVQKTPWFQSAGSGCGIIPCNTAYINWLGFITIPFLALIAFTLITVLQILIIRNARSAAGK
ncbi:disulfide bond formation protein B [Xylanibacillus composti]|nr:disulfide oxidoreductase [Xylanibacillus composti]MDT9724918.1 disulfide bond formation protein B [Xylanibacillus composti]